MALVPSTTKGTVRLRFCRESNDLLHPREDTLRKKLVYYCRTCDYTEDAGDEAEDNCVYRNFVHHAATEKTVIQMDVSADPALPRTREATCPKEGCGNREAVFFSTVTAEGMTLFYQCTACQQKWQDVV